MKLCEWQCTVVTVLDESELSVCAVTVCEESNNVTIFLWCFVLFLCTNTCHALSGNMPDAAEVACVRNNAKCKMIVKEVSSVDRK